MPFPGSRPPRRPKGCAQREKCWCPVTIPSWFRQPPIFAPSCRKKKLCRENRHSECSLPICLASWLCVINPPHDLDLPPLPLLVLLRSFEACGGQIGREMN